jgi:hypothetical protein
VGDHERRVKVNRNPRDVSRKVLAGALGGITVSGLVWAGGLAGLQVDPALAGVIVTTAAALAGYWKHDTKPDVAG